MTVKELKEVLEIFILEGDEDFTVFVDNSEDSWILNVDEENKVVIL